MNRGALEIRIGVGSCGVASGSEPVRAVLMHEAQQADIAEQLVVHPAAQQRDAHGGHETAAVAVIIEIVQPHEAPHQNRGAGLRIAQGLRDLAHRRRPAAIG